MNMNEQESNFPRYIYISNLHKILEKIKNI